MQGRKMWDTNLRYKKVRYAKCRNLKVMKFRVQVVAYNMHIFELYMNSNESQQH